MYRTLTVHKIRDWGAINYPENWTRKQPARLGAIAPTPSPAPCGGHKLAVKGFSGRQRVVDDACEPLMTDFELNPLSNKALTRYWSLKGRQRTLGRFSGRAPLRAGSRWLPDTSSRAEHSDGPSRPFSHDHPLQPVDRRQRLSFLLRLFVGIHNPCETAEPTNSTIGKQR